MSQTITLTLTPGQQINQALPATGKIAVVDLANSSPFDLTYSGFGCPGSMIITAGLMERLYAKVLNTGQMSIFPVDNVNAGGTGIVNITVYFASETVPPGTYPVFIPVQTVKAKVSSVSTLSNEGGAISIEVIDIGTVNNAKLIDIFNDHFTISVEQGGVKHTILQGNATGIPGQLGQANDTTEVLGNLKVDQTAGTSLNVAGACTFNSSVAGDTVIVDATGNVNVGHTNPSGANNVNVNGNVRVNGFFSVFDNGGTARPQMTTLSLLMQTMVFCTS